MDNLPKLHQALYHLRTRNFSTCADLCTDILSQYPYDQAAWHLKTRAMSAQAFLDDTETERDGGVGGGVAGLDDPPVTGLPRPGTSLTRGTTPSPSATAGPNLSIRPASGMGRPLVGFARPSTVNRDGATSAGLVRLGTATTASGRMMSSASGRLLRLGTASFLTDPTGPFINVDKLDLQKYASRPALARALFNYIYYHLDNPRKALELASFATAQHEYKDWWWKQQIGKCFHRLRLFREAERHLKSSLKDQDILSTHLHLANVFLKLDQPKTVIQIYTKALDTHPGSTALMVGLARVSEQVGDSAGALKWYKQVLQHDGSNVEALSSLASNAFYSDQPESAVKYYRRLLQMGVTTSPELWANLGLSTFYAQQFDMSLSCFERALMCADDDSVVAEIWYNLGHIGINVGDLTLAYRCLKIAVVADARHAEAWNNLGVLEYHLNKSNTDLAQSHFFTSSETAPYLHEPWYNAGEILRTFLKKLYPCNKY
ncbi:Tetratricopeptide repeat protein 8 [Borealophlyctis nickersoniae]|nr:Tetratricopeptide repeat protein 8 [Borealophlyctis nickersoniae]